MKGIKQFIIEQLRADTLDRMKVVILQCATVDDLHEELYNKDQWFIMHSRYEDEALDDFWHGNEPNSYCNDEELQRFEDSLWRIALGAAGKRHWIPGFRL